ncbi:hypothetical protein M3J09_003706 [Ascochyta lentis]
MCLKCSRSLVSEHVAWDARFLSPSMILSDC